MTPHQPGSGHDYMYAVAVVVRHQERNSEPLDGSGQAMPFGKTIPFGEGIVPVKSEPRLAL